VTVADNGESFWEGGHGAREIETTEPVVVYNVIVPKRYEFFFIFWL